MIWQTINVYVNVLPYNNEMMAFYIKKVKGQLHIDFPYFWCLYSTVTQEQKGDFYHI